MSGRAVSVALAQLTPGPDLDENLATIEGWGAEAAAAGAEWLLLPEYASFLHGRRREMAQAAARWKDVIGTLSRLARRHRLWVLLGSLVLPGPDGKLLNRSVWLDEAGRLVAWYDKLHLFDVKLPDGREIFESRAYVAGATAVVARAPWAEVGLSICYDLRFPQLYRALAAAGAQVLVVPSAFARQTGPAHWRALLQARAIENSAWVLAPATCGTSPGERESHGHSLVVDPWGQVTAELADEPGLLLASIDAAAVDVARRRLPGLQHDRPFAVRRPAVPAAPLDILSTWSFGPHDAP